MNYKTTIAAALAALVLLSGAAVAMPGNAPDHAGADNGSDAADATDAGAADATPENV